MGSVIENAKTKEKCQIFTPDDIVETMLDHVGYIDSLYGKTILENSCGNGQFLKGIVKRYINDCKRKGLSRTNVFLNWTPKLNEALMAVRLFQSPLSKGL